MRRLIIANTYYQVIFAMQMRNTIFKRDDVDLIITDHSKNADVVCENIKKCKYFNNCYYVKTGGYRDNRTKMQKILDIFLLSFAKKNRFEYYLRDISDKFFDEIMVFNYDMRTYGVFSILSLYNHDIKVSRFEEGVLSYSVEILFTQTRTLIGKLRKIIGKPVIENSFLNFYCFYPQIYKGYLKPVEVPMIQLNSEICVALRKVFELDDKKLSYKYKYIFFTSVYDFEGGKPVGEYELVCKIADIVGKDNLLIKTHPRDTRTLYVDNGFNVDENSSVPWEAIQLSGKFDDKVFMTINSGSVLSGSLMSKNKVKTFYMYKMCDYKGNESCQKNVIDIEALLKNSNMKSIFNNVQVAEKIEDIL